MLIVRTDSSVARIKGFTWSQMKCSQERINAGVTRKYLTCGVDSLILKLELRKTNEGNVRCDDLLSEKGESGDKKSSQYTLWYSTNRVLC